MSGAGNLRAITLWRPWGQAVAHFGKTVENRPWDTRYRGPIAIHSGLRWDPAGEYSPLVQAGWREYIKTLPPDNVARPRLTRDSLWADTGVVAVADLVGVCSVMAHSPLAECDCGPWAATLSYHFQLDNVRPLRHAVPCRGRQQIWRLPDDVQAKVDSEL